MHGRFTAYAFNALSGARIGELVYTDLSFSDGLNGTGSGSITLPWWQDLVEDVLPGPVGIAFDDEGSIMWSGWARMRQVNPDQGTVRIGLDSWWSYYDVRTLRSRTGMTYARTTNVGPQDIVFQAVDQFSIVDDMLDHAAAVAGAADIGLTVRMFGPGAGGLSGVTRTRTFYGYERKKIAQAVTELASQQGGFDFTVGSAWDTGTSPYSVGLYLDLFYPRRGASTSTPVLEHGSNVQVLSVTDDATVLANPLVGVGAGTGDAALTVESISSAYLYPAGPYPYTEGEVQYRDEGAEYAGNLTRLTDARLAATRSPLRTAEAEITEAGGTRLGDVGVGDTVRVVAEFGPFAFDEQMRVISQSISIDSGGLRTWKVSLAPNDASLGIL